MLNAGDILADRYRIERMLGEGGMGAVYEAENVSVGKRVAIKVLHADFAKNESVVGRFQREARGAAGIGHEHIVEVFDFGTHDGAPFMVMELLRGESLGARLARVNVLPHASAVFIVTQVLEALGAAHEAGIVHRDLKPDNVFLIRRHGRGDFVKLLDFGISKFQEDDTKRANSITQAGLVIGTPDYMAPEQALAKPNIDRRADLYSAGAVLYHMLTGRLPFTAETDRELLAIVAFRPAGLTTPREIDPSLPVELDSIVLKSMSLDRNERFQDAAAMCAALEPFCGEAPPAARSGAWPTQTISQQPPTPLEWQKPTTLESLEPAAFPSGASQPPRSMPPRARPRATVGAAAALLSVIALIAGVRAVVRPSAPDRSAATVQRSAVVTSRPVVPTAPAPPASVHVDIEGLDGTASVLVDGQPGTTHLSFAPQSVHRLHVSAPGMIPFDSSITADHDRTVAIALAAVPVVAVAPAVHTVAAPVAEASAPRRGHHRTAEADAGSATAAPASRSALQFNTEY